MHSLPDPALLSACESLGGRLLALYHYPCPDGAFAALAAYLRWSRSGLLHRARFVPHSVYVPSEGKPGDPSSALCGVGPNDAVFLLDYAGPPGMAASLAASTGCAVIVLDHHKTALETLPSPGTPGFPPSLALRLDLARSGATLARDFFGALDALQVPSESRKRDRLALAFAYVQDADLWAWAMPGSRAFHAGLAASGIDYDATDASGTGGSSDPSDGPGSNAARTVPGQAETPHSNLNGARAVALFEALSDVDPGALIASGEALLGKQEEDILRLLDTAFAIALPLGPRASSQSESDGASEGDACGPTDARSPLNPRLVCLCVRGAGPGIARIRSELGSRLAIASAARGLAGVGAIAYREAGMGETSGLKLSLRSCRREEAAAAIRQKDVELELGSGGGHEAIDVAAGGGPGADSDSGVDVAAIAQVLGGGGHHNAASCVLLGAEKELERWRRAAPATLR